MVTLAIKEKLQEISREYIEIFLKMKKIKKEMMLTIEIKISKRNKKWIYEKLLLYIKNLLNNLIKWVEELEHVYK